MPSTSLERCSIEGFYGASSIERLPTEVAITNQVNEFVELELSQKGSTRDGLARSEGSQSIENGRPILVR